MCVCDFCVIKERFFLIWIIRHDYQVSILWVKYRLVPKFEFIKFNE